MDWKSLALGFAVCLLFATTAVAIGEAISPGDDPTNKPTANAIVAISNDDETVLVNKYSLEGNIDDDFTVQDIKDYENRTISFKLYRKDLFNGAETSSTSLYICTDTDATTGECLAERIKTEKELDTEKKALIEAKIASIANITRERNAVISTAVIGTGTVTKE